MRRRRIDVGGGRIFDLGDRYAIHRSSNEELGLGDYSGSELVVVLSVSASVEEGEKVIVI